MDIIPTTAQPVKLRCRIVETNSWFMRYIVYDENNIGVAEGCSSSPDWVRHDAGGYHTKERFDKMFPQGWEVSFDF
jgi:hypothetical protein